MGKFYSKDLVLIVDVAGMIRLVGGAANHLRMCDNLEYTTRYAPNLSLGMYRTRHSAHRTGQSYLLRCANKKKKVELFSLFAQRVVY